MRARIHPMDANTIRLLHQLQRFAFMPGLPSASTPRTFPQAFRRRLVIAIAGGRFSAVAAVLSQLIFQSTKSPPLPLSGRRREFLLRLAGGLRSLNLFSQTFIFLTTRYSFLAEQLPKKNLSFEKAGIPVTVMDTDRIAEFLYG